jgi:cytidylate kinase
MMEREGPIVTLDGPAGSGKSSTAKAVAARLGFRHLDSGALYRALTLALLEASVPEDRWAGLSEGELAALPVEVEPAEGGFTIRVGGRIVDAELRAPRVTERVSNLARVPAVRACLLRLQRDAGSRGRLVADGRDMGTVVFPDAEVKVFLEADLTERARRRLLETGVGSPSADEVDRQRREIAERDRRDSERDISPLRRPRGAHDLDTTELTFDEQVERVVALVAKLTAP